MELLYLVYLSSGLFLGWSLGANDASNIFGTAVGSKMVRFGTMALISSIFIILGAVYGGEGTSNTLSSLGSVNALAGSFMVALSSALSLYVMSRAGLTVSSSQAVVGAIIGWNLYVNKPTNLAIMAQIFGTWTVCPLLAGVIAVIIFLLMKNALKYSKMHLLMRDQLTRIGLVVTAGLSAYALGANNIANVVGMFIDSCPFHSISIAGVLTFSPTQILFFLGAVAISVGIFTYSKKVIMTVGNNLMRMTPMSAFVVVLSQAVVLILFSSVTLHNFLTSHSLPALPLVPVSSTQAVIGAIIGIGLLKGGRGINWNIVGKIVVGWIAAPIMSLAICFISLFFLENVFNQIVYVAG